MTEPIDPDRPAQPIADGGRPVTSPAACIDVDALRRLAEAATPGPWFVVGPPWMDADLSFVIAGAEDPHVGRFVCDLENMAGEVPTNPVANGAFIAATDPPTVLALLDELATTRAMLGETREWLLSHECEASS